MLHIRPFEHAGHRHTMVKWRGDCQTQLMGYYGAPLTVLIFTQDSSDGRPRTIYWYPSLNRRELRSLLLTLAYHQLLSAIHTEKAIGKKWRKDITKVAKLEKNNAALKWNQAPSLIVESSTLTSVAIVSQINGSPLNLDISSSLDESFKNKLVVPKYTSKGHHLQ